jgi:hypothetical protein
MDWLMQRLEPSTTFASDPSLVPVILSSIAAHSLREGTDKNVMACRELEYAMGYWSRDGQGEDLSQILDVTRMPQLLNNLSINTTHSDTGCSSMEVVIDCLANQLQTLPNVLCTSVSAELHEQSELVRQSVLGIRVFNQQMKEVFQSMIQTVLLQCLWTRASEAQAFRYTQRSNKRTTSSTIATAPTCD